MAIDDLKVAFRDPAGVDMSIKPAEPEMQSNLNRPANQMVTPEQAARANMGWGMSAQVKATNEPAIDTGMEMKAQPEFGVSARMQPQPFDNYKVELAGDSLKDMKPGQFAKNDSIFGIAETFSSEMRDLKNMVDGPGMQASANFDMRPQWTMNNPTFG